MHLIHPEVVSLNYEKVLYTTFRSGSRDSMRRTNFEGKIRVQAIILCGGLAKRLGNTTKTVPKVLLEIGDKTVLEWQIQLLKDANVEEVILASGHLHDVLYDRVGVCYAGISIRYSKEEKRLGTGGAIRNAMEYVSSFPFFVLNGDILLSDFSLRDMLCTFHRGMSGLLLSVRVDDIRPYGEIVSDKERKVTAFREKQLSYRSGYINGGVYLFSHTIVDVFPEAPDSFSIEQDVFPNLQNLYTLQTNADWIDIGVPDRLAYARAHFQNGDLQ